MIASPSVLSGAEPPLSSTSGCPAKPGCVVPSIVTGSLIVGSGEAGAIVCTSEPGIANEIVFAPGAAFACSIAARSVQWPVPSSQTWSIRLASPPSPVESTTYADGVNGADVTVNGTFAELFAASGSVWAAVTVALADTGPGTVGKRMTVTVAEPPFGIVPSVQVAWPRTPLHEPLDVETDKNVASGGYESDSAGTEAASGPWFVTWKVRSSWWPGSTGDGDAVPVTPRSTVPLMLQALNSDVSRSPCVGFPIVSVPETDVPAGIAGTDAESVPLPEVRSTGKVPRKFAPSPEPDASQAAFEYSCTFTVAPGTPSTVPVIVELPPLVVTPVSVREPVNGMSFWIPLPPLSVIVLP